MLYPRFHAAVLALFLLAVAIQRSSAQSDLTLNASVYEGIYPDIQNVYGNNQTAAANHYVAFGRSDGRRASIVFDPVYYLQRYPDLVQAYGPTNYQAAEYHFINFGLGEGRRGSLEFDAPFYLANNPDAVARIGSSTDYVAAAHDFLNTGLVTHGSQGSADVDVKAYINNYPDVAAAYGTTSYLNAMLHWLRRGKQFGRQPIGTVVTTTDCSAANPPAGFTRVYIAFRSDELDGSGNTAADPRNGNLFDSILNFYSHDPAGGMPSADHLIICLGPGTFHTDGSFNWVINIPHSSQVIQSRGFIVGPYWHIHGAGMSQTIVQLASYYVPPPQGEPGGVLQGSNLVFATGSNTSPGIEISDMTIDCNFPNLKAQNPNQPLLLQAIRLRDDTGKHYLHHLNIINVASEIQPLEAFPVQIESASYTNFPDQHSHPPVAPSQDNKIEFVTMSGFHGQLCTAISFAFATGSIQYNVVNGYDIAYGGFELPFVSGDEGKFVYFHDNFALFGRGGFNIDSEFNDGVNIQFNSIVDPSQFGIVVGTSLPRRFDNFTFLYNTIERISTLLTGVIFNGNVTNTIMSRTNFVNDEPFSGTAVSTANSNNAGNVYQYNQIDNAFGVSFSSQSPSSASCVFGNVDQGGNPRSDFPNNQSTPCRSWI